MEGTLEPRKGSKDLGVLSLKQTLPKKGSVSSVSSSFSDWGFPELTITSLHLGSLEAGALPRLSDWRG